MKRRKKNEEKNPYDHLSWCGKSIWQNSIPFCEKKILTNIGIKRNYLHIIKAVYEEKRYPDGPKTWECAHPHELSEKEILKP